uniref:Si:dkey-192p21.6 n=1 Tax=Eptatretus burgeri TaxID=7764 RepID=A0A8C4QCR5_EPTBU
MSRRSIFSFASFHTMTFEVLTVVFAVLGVTAQPEDYFHHHVEQDKALVTISLISAGTADVSWVSEDCYHCLKQELISGLHPQKSFRHMMDTQHPLTIFVTNHPASSTQQVESSTQQVESSTQQVESSTQQVESSMQHTVPATCRVKTWLGEQGEYTVTIQATHDAGGIGPNRMEVDTLPSLNCTLTQTQMPINSNLPLWVLLALMLGSVLAVLLKDFLRRRYRGRFHFQQLFNTEAESTDAQEIILVPDRTTHSRFVCVDTFRGISIVLMIFVNYGGGGYWFFKHSRWNGLTFADVVMPWFVFVLGASVALALNPARRRTSRTRAMLKVLFRTVTLITLGILLINQKPCKKSFDFINLRLPGVLQRLAIAFFISALVFLLLPTHDNGRRAYYPEIIIILTLLTLCSIWLSITFLITLPYGCPTGYLGPGGIGDWGLYPNCTGGAAGLIDQLIIGPSHLYQHPTSTTTYLTSVPYDPEGILGILTCTALALIGLQAGRWLISLQGNIKHILMRFLFSAITLVRFGENCVSTKACDQGRLWEQNHIRMFDLSFSKPSFTSSFLSFAIFSLSHLKCSIIFQATLAAALSKCSRDGGFIPINKNLWSLSYVALCGSLSLVMLLFLYCLTDKFHFWKGQPFIYPGKNAILLYLGHELLWSYFPLAWPRPNRLNHEFLLAQDATTTLLWVIVAFVLHRKGVFLSI